MNSPNARSRCADPNGTTVAYLFLGEGVHTFRRGGALDELWREYFQSCPAGSFFIRIHAQLVPWIPGHGNGTRDGNRTRAQTRMSVLAPNGSLWHEHGFAGEPAGFVRYPMQGPLRGMYRMVKATNKLLRLSLRPGDADLAPNGCAATWLHLASESTSPMALCGAVHKRLAMSKRSLLDAHVCDKCAQVQPERLRAWLPTPNGETSRGGTHGHGDAGSSTDNHNGRGSRTRTPFIKASQWATLRASDAAKVLAVEKRLERLWRGAFVSDEYYLPQVLGSVGVDFDWRGLTYVEFYKMRWLPSPRWNEPSHGKFVPVFTNDDHAHWFYVDRRTWQNRSRGVESAGIRVDSNGHSHFQPCGADLAEFARFVVEVRESGKLFARKFDEGCLRRLAAVLRKMREMRIDYMWDMRMALPRLPRAFAGTAHFGAASTTSPTPRRLASPSRRLPAGCGHADTCEAGRNWTRGELKALQEVLDGKLGPQHLPPCCVL